MHTDPYLRKLERERWEEGEECEAEARLNGTIEELVEAFVEDRNKDGTPGAARPRVWVMFDEDLELEDAEMVPIEEGILIDEVKSTRRSCRHHHASSCEKRTLPLLTESTKMRTMGRCAAQWADGRVQTRRSEGVAWKRWVQPNLNRLSLSR